MIELPHVTIEGIMFFSLVICCAVAHQPNFASALVDRNASVAISYWSQEKDQSGKISGNNHLLIVGRDGKVSRDFRLDRSFSQVHVSPDRRYVAITTQVPLEAGEKPEYITEIPPFNTLVQLFDSNRKVFEKVYRSTSPQVSWKDNSLIVDSEVIREDEKHNWREDKTELNPADIGILARPSSRGDFFQRSSDRRSPGNVVFRYHDGNTVKKSPLLSQCPWDLQYLDGTQFYLYVDGIGGGIYQFDCRTGKSVRTSVPHYFAAAWLSGPKVLAFQELVKMGSSNVLSLRNWTSKETRKMSVKGQSITNLLALNDHQLIVQSWQKSGQHMLFQLVDVSSGKMTQLPIPIRSEVTQVAMTPCRDN